MPRARTEYNFVEEVNGEITTPIPSEDIHTAVTVWCKDAWQDAIDKIRSEDITALIKYEILVSGNLSDVDNTVTYGSVELADAASGLDHFKPNFRATLKNRKAGNLFVYYGDEPANIRAFVIIGEYLYRFEGNDADALELLKDYGRESVKYYGAAYAEPAESTAHNNSGDAVIEGHPTL